MKLYLIRHGATLANELHLYCGSTDLPLSPEGRTALQPLNWDLTGLRCLTSGMLRTEQTFQALFGSHLHTAEPRFREVDFGIFEMKSYQQLRQDPAYQAWLTGDNEQNVPPGGESGEQMRTRVLAAFRELEGDTLLVTHGGVIAALMASLFPQEGKNRYQWQPEPGHGYLVTEDGYRPLF